MMIHTTLFSIFFSRLFLSLLMVMFFLFPLANLAIHEIFLSERLGNQWEFWLYGASSLALYTFYTHYMLRKHARAFDMKKALSFGLVWMFLFMAVFFLMALGFFNLSWKSVFASFNPFNYELMPFICILIGGLPALFLSFQK